MSLGYENAPITLILTVLTIILSLFFGSSEIVSFDLKKLYQFELWRLFSSQCVFSNIAQTFIGMLLLYICRQFERQLGSKKYGGFVCLSFLLSILIQVLVITITDAADLDYTPAHGPFFLIFSLLPLFYAYIPKLQSTEFSLLGIGFSEKSWTYLLGLQLGLSQGLRSLLPSVIGLLFGYLYLKNILYVQRFRLPKRLETCLKAIGSYILSFVPIQQRQTPLQAAAGTTRRPPPATAAATAAANARSTSGRSLREMLSGGGGGRGENDWGDLSGGGGDDYGSTGSGGGSMFAPTRQPTEAEIESVTALGFDRNAAIQALRNTDNNVEAAANMLLR